MTATQTWPDPTHRVQPGRTEPLAKGWVDYLGGPMGRYAQIGRARFWTPLRAIFALAYVFLTLGGLSKANCSLGKPDDNGVLQLNWDGNRQFTSFCYNDIVPLYGARGLDQPGFVYDYSWVEDGLTRYMEYPVLAGLFQQFTAFISRNTYFVASKFLPEVGWYFWMTVLFLSIIWICTARMVAELAGNRIWDTLLVVGSPLLIMHAFTNWDIPSIFFLVAALLAARNKKWWLAGILIGAGTSFKLWPLFVLGAYLTIAIRKRSFVPFFKMLAATVVTWLVINVPVYLRNADAWGEFNRLNTDRGWEWTTIYAVISRTFGWSGFDTGEGAPVILNTVTFVLFAAGCLAVLIMGLKAPKEPRVAELLCLIVGFFLLFNKVWSPVLHLAHRPSGARAAALETALDVDDGGHDGLAGTHVAHAWHRQPGTAWRGPRHRDHLPRRADHHHHGAGCPAALRPPPRPGCPGPLRPRPAAYPPHRLAGARPCLTPQLSPASCPSRCHSSCSLEPFTSRRKNAPPSPSPWASQRFSS